MRSFDYIESGKTLLTPHTTSLLAAIHEAKGRQSIQTTIRPDILGTLVAVARIQSTDASNRIEGISTSDSRLNDLVSEKVTPRNRNEEEIAGYRDALSVIHESHDYIPITPNVILQLHRDLFRHTPLTFAVHFKDSDNVIIERDAHGTSTVRFAPPSAIRIRAIRAVGGKTPRRRGSGEILRHLYVRKKGFLERISNLL